MIRDGWQALVTAILDCEKPVIAGVNGTAAGGGMHLALACDLVVMAEEAKFVEVFIRRGIAPDAGGAWILTRLVGIQKAKELFFFGDDVPAAEAYRIGLVNRLVPRAELQATLEEMAGRLAKAPTKAIWVTKWLTNRALDVDRATSLYDEAIGQEIVTHTAGLQGGHRQLRGAPPGRVQGLVADRGRSSSVPTSPHRYWSWSPWPGGTSSWSSVPVGAVVLVGRAGRAARWWSTSWCWWRGRSTSWSSRPPVPDGETMLPNVVPLSPPPKMADSGLPAISSTAVMNKSASTNTTAAVPAMTCQVNRARRRSRRFRSEHEETAARVWSVTARRWVAGVAGVPAVAEISRRWVSSAGAVVEAVSAVGSDTDSDAPRWVPRKRRRGRRGPSADDRGRPSRRSRCGASGARTTCLTAS